MLRKQSTRRDLKIVILGDQYSDKTKLIQRLASKPCCTTKTFGYQHITITYKGRQRNILLCTCNEYDVLSQNRLSMYNEADVFIICFSVVNPETLDSVLGFWVPEIRVHYKNFPFILVGTQMELRNDEKVQQALTRRGMKSISYERALSIKTRIHATEYIECSTTAKINIDKILQQAITLSLKRKKKSIMSLFKRDKWNIFKYDPIFSRAVDHYKQLCQAEIFFQKGGYKDAFLMYDTILNDHPGKWAKRVVFIKLKRMQHFLKKYCKTDTTMTCICEFINEIFKIHRINDAYFHIQPFGEILKEVLIPRTEKEIFLSLKLREDSPLIHERYIQRRIILDESAESLELPKQEIMIPPLKLCGIQQFEEDDGIEEDTASCSESIVTTVEIETIISAPTSPTSSHYVKQNKIKKKETNNDALNIEKRTNNGIKETNNDALDIEEQIKNEVERIPISNSRKEILKKFFTVPTPNENVFMEKLSEFGKKFKSPVKQIESPMNESQKREENSLFLQNLLHQMDGLSKLIQHQQQKIEDLQKENMLLIESQKVIRNQLDQILKTIDHFKMMM